MQACPDRSARPPEPNGTDRQPSAAKRSDPRIYFAKVQSDLLSQGLMRTDGGRNDAPYTDRMLADNFIRIALYDEYKRGSAGLVQEETVSRLRRWDVPVRVGLHFGASVPPATRATDRARVSSYLARLSHLTGHPISLSDDVTNFFLYFVNEDERRALGPVIRNVLPDLSPPRCNGLTICPDRPIALSMPCLKATAACIPAPLP